MSVLIDEDRASAPRRGLAGGFADGPLGGGGANRAELWRRLWFTLGALIVYRIGGYLPIPGVDLIAVNEFRHIAFLTGGVWIPDLSIFSLGIMPYISAVVLVELVKHFVPRLGGLAMAGPEGRRKLNQYARILTVALAAFQAVGVAFGLEELREVVTLPRLPFEATTILALTAGAVLVMWLAEQITARGIGNGVLVIIACGIVSQLPLNVGRAIESVRMGDVEAIWLLIALAMMVAVIALVVTSERAACRIWIHDPAGEIGVHDADRRYAHIPLKLNPTGVLAPIAATVLATPLSGLIASAGGRGTFVYREFAIGGSSYLLLDALLIILFAVFFGLATFNADETARKLRDTHGFVPGYRPGEMTARHLQMTQVVLVTLGAVYLVTVCVLPDLFYRWTVLWPLFGGYQLFLLAWLAVHALEQIRRFARP